MNEKQKDLSFTKILDKLIAAKALKDLHLLSLKELEIEIPKLINSDISSIGGKQIYTLLKNINTLVVKAPEFLIDEISITHPNLLTPLTTTTNLNPNILPSKTEELIETQDILENQICLFAPTDVVQETQSIENVISVDNSSLQKIINLENEILEIKNELVTKDSVILNLENKLATYESTSSDSSNELDINYNNSFTMNDVLSYKSLDSTLVDIKLPKDLVIQSSYFIDSNKIINLPTLVKSGNDLDSEIIKAMLMVILKNYKLI